MQKNQRKVYKLVSNILCMSVRITQCHHLLWLKQQGI